MNKVNETFLIGKFLIFSLIIIFSSCSTDNEEQQEENPSSAINSIEVDGNSYELSKAFIHFGKDPEETEGEDLYYHDIIIASSDVNLDQSNEEFTGSESSHFMDITITSISQSSIPNGTYNYSTWSDGEDFKMVWSSFDSTSLESGIDMEEGTITVKQEGNKISLEFNLISENNKEVTGSYNGEFEEYFFER